MTFRAFEELFEQNVIAKIWEPYRKIKFLILSLLPYLSYFLFKFKTRLKACILGLNFLSELAGWELQLP